MRDFKTELRAARHRFHWSDQLQAYVRMGWLNKSRTKVYIERISPEEVSSLRSPLRREKRELSKTSPGEYILWWEGGKGKDVISKLIYDHGPVYNGMAVMFQ